MADISSTIKTRRQGISLEPGLETRAYFVDVVADGLTAAAEHTLISVEAGKMIQSVAIVVDTAVAGTSSTVTFELKTGSGTDAPITGAIAEATLVAGYTFEVNPFSAATLTDTTPAPDANLLVNDTDATILKMTVGTAVLTAGKFSVLLTLKDVLPVVAGEAS